MKKRWFRRENAAGAHEDAGLIIRDDEGEGAGALVDEELAGERTIPSVNRERSVQSRVSSVLALAAVLLLGGGFLVWYYTNAFQKNRGVDAENRRKVEARAAGEMKLPPLGPVAPPRAIETAAVMDRPASIGDVLGPPPPLAPIPVIGARPGPTQAPPPSPEELAWRRKLGQPVMYRTVAGGGQAGPPGVAGPVQTGADGVSGALASLLTPTATPSVRAQTLPTRRLLLPKGAFVDCTLETALDSSLPGMTTCITAYDIFGADGQVVLLERGSKLVGETRGEAKRGQGRVFVLWNEARTPNGVVVQLASPGTDELGRSGLPGFVDNHFWDRFGAAILISVIDGTIQGIASSQRSGSGDSIVISPRGTNDVLTEVLRNTINIPPTIVKNQGERIQILVARDVDFRSVYALRTAP